MLYDGWLTKLANRFQAEFSYIEATHNFELGDEFEIAVCGVLRRILPRRYGVVRGFVVSQNGERAGDDIIIFDAQKFPTLRVLEGELARLESVPAEAVLAYIEAKHTLHLDNARGQSLSKATEQVSNVKSVPRARVPAGTIAELGGAPFKIERNPGWPTYENPYYGAVWARRVEGRDLSAANVAEDLRSLATQRTHFPDAVIADSLVAWPVYANGDGTHELRPFLCDDTELAVALPVAAALGIGVAHLLWALEHIQLGTVPWFKMMAEHLMAAPVEKGTSPIRGTGDGASDDLRADGQEPPSR